MQREAQAVERAVDGMQVVARMQSERVALLQHPCTPQRLLVAQMSDGLEHVMDDPVPSQ